VGFVNRFIPPCTLVLAECFAEDDMDKPTNLIPDWLTIDLVTIVLGLILIGIWMELL
jgi:hypothetical protein